MSEEEIEWTPFDPSWLVKLAREQSPKEKWLSQALAECTHIMPSANEATIYFVNPINANEPNAIYQFKGNTTLYSPTKGWLILDVLKGNKIGSLDYYDKLNKGPYIECPCGFILTSATVAKNKWLTFDDEQYKTLADIELQLHLNTLDRKNENLMIKQKRLQRGLLYECSNCGRIMWRKYGKGNYQIYSPEGTVY